MRVGLLDFDFSQPGQAWIGRKEHSQAQDAGQGQDRAVQGRLRAATGHPAWHWKWKLKYFTGLFQWRFLLIIIIFLIPRTQIYPRYLNHVSLILLQEPNLGAELCTDMGENTPFATLVYISMCRTETKILLTVAMEIIVVRFFFHKIQCQWRFHLTSLRKCSDVFPGTLVW